MVRKHESVFYAALLLTALIVALPVQATDMPGMDMAAKPTDTLATKDFKSGMAAMDRGMGQYTGDTDRDFVTNMLPHHQGAVAMAQTELKYGHDPELKQLAHNIIAAQDKEIAFMKAWQAKHGEK